MKRALFCFFSLLFFHISLDAQVTTASMSGKITGEGETLIGATIQAIHIPSGTSYGVISNEKGYYNIQGMRVGGPYKITVSYIGYVVADYSDIMLSLGKTNELNVTLHADQINLPDIEIVSSKTTSYDKSESSIRVNIEGIPSISRSINDLTKLFPQSGINNSFGGRDGRYNNISIDGAAFNNNYGLSSKNLPGGDAQPISFDAIEEISVSMTPYDIRQSNFTGANINAVTKSGGNTFHGTAYSFLRPKSLTGNLVDETPISGANDRASQLYGLNLGGSFIKNKLFFFVSGEYEKQDFPGPGWMPSVNGEADASHKLSRTTISDMETTRDFLLNRYQYDPGNALHRNDFNSSNYKILARIDWNINKNHRLMIRYNDVLSHDDTEVNPNSAPRPRGSSNRNSLQAIAFPNSNYKNKNIVRSLTGELNSDFGNKYANTLLLSYTRIRDTRDSDSKPFPFVDIYKDNDMYMSFGYELFTYNTDLTNDVLNFTDNFSIYMGKHTLTAGISFNYLHFKNTYMRYALGYYRYASLDDFINDAKPTSYALTYGYNPNETPGFSLDFGMGSLYAQDEWRVNEKLTLVGGIRLEMPFYMNQLPNNPAINDTLTFYNGETVHIDQWPSNSVFVSPRLGFEWNMTDNEKITMRGGTGIFTGLMPFVWLTNQVADNGMIQNTIELVGANVPDDLRFEPDFQAQIDKYPTIFPSEAALKAPGQISFSDRNFNLPQVWRSSLAFDFKLPYDMVFTVEGIFGYDINMVVQRNINESAPSGTLKEGDLERDSWWVKNESGGWEKNNTIQPMTYAMKLTNDKGGYQFSATGQLSKSFSHRISGMAAYTFNLSKDFSANAGSSSLSMWTNNAAVNSLNNPGLSFSSFSIPHRVVGSLTWHIESGKNLGFWLSAAYQGSSQGRYSYIYNGDMNGDNNNSDLMYIPKNENDMQLIATPEMSVSDQAAALWSYIENDNYLSKNVGQFSERNGYIGPWINRIDLKIMQDIFTTFKTDRRYTLRLSLDILNIGNLLNSNWGCYQIHGLENNGNIHLLTFLGLDDNGNPTYQLNASDVDEFNKNAKFVKDASVRSTWGAQIGLRFLF